MGIEYPKIVSEAEIQAELYWCLRIRYCADVRLAVTARNDKETRSLLDVVVFSHERIPICAIECKRGKSKPSEKQLKKYKSFGIPVLICNSTNINWVLAKVSEMVGGIPLNTELVEVENAS